MCLSALQRTLGRAEGSLRSTAVRTAESLTGDPRVQKLLVEADLACHAHGHQIRTAMAENRMIRRQASAIR